MSQSSVRVRSCNSRSIKIRQLNYTKRTNSSMNNCQSAIDDLNQSTVNTAKMIAVSEILKNARQQNSSVQLYKPLILKTQNSNLNQTYNVLMQQQDTEPNYCFRYRVNSTVSQLENPNSYTHYLEDFVQGNKTIQSYIKSCKQENQEIKQQSQILQFQIQSTKDQLLDELKDTAENVIPIFKRIKNKISQDFAKHQQNQFELHKEITKLKRENYNFIQQIEISYQRIAELEKQINGAELYDFQEFPDVNEVQMGGIKPFVE